MGRLGLLALCLAALPPEAGAQQPVQPILGLVRRLQDTLPVADAEVLIGTRRTSTNAQGRFHVDSMRPGIYPLTIRRVGYRPVRSRIAVLAAEPTEVEYYLLLDPFRLPTVEVEASRPGIYGKVGDTAFRALPGARVTLLGRKGTEVLADSSGGFAFGRLPDASYMVRVSKRGYAERRALVELSKGKGVQLSFLLAPEARPRLAPGEEAALFDLGRRLALGFRRERMTRGELERYGSQSVCDVPRVRSVVGSQQVGVLNGVTTLLPGQLCSWQMDEIGLIEFIQGSLRRGPGGSRRGAGYVIIWEKR